MPTAPTADGGASSYSKAAGSEPIPGYVLIEPLGRGGFGEVWKCEAPGGLHKAIKFVGGDDDGITGDGACLRQEFDAFQKIKAIRHPFLLTLERVELVQGELVMVMELADRQLADRFKECREQGLPGIPRDELLGYFDEAAEALDVIGTQFGLQHLDVKPANLFLTAGHVKVGDYGLVSTLDGGKGDGIRGLTPKYVAPEVLRGEVHTRSDQYSLALVYFELLTGAFPYTGRSPQQLMVQHVSVQPDVSALPPCDQSPVWTALQKKPADRFASCREFVRALAAAHYTGPAPVPSGSTPAPRITGGTSTMGPLRQPTQFDLPRPPGEGTGRHPRPGEITDRHPQPGELTGRHPQPGSTPGEPLTARPEQTLPWAGAGGRLLPGLVTPGSREIPFPPPPPNPPEAAEEDLPLAEPDAPTRVRINPIRSVVAAARFRGEPAPAGGGDAAAFVAAVVAAAAAGGHVPQLPGDLGRTADGTWVCRFPSTVPALVVPHKLAVLRERWGVTVVESDQTRVVLRAAAPGGFWGGLSKKSGLEVVIGLPKAGRSVGEVAVTAGVFGAADRTFTQTAQDLIPKIMADVRRELGNVEDRRKATRVAAELALTVHPFHSDGVADPAVPGKCRDVSAGGVCFTTDAPLGTKYAYLEFDGVAETAGLAILVKLLRAQGQVYGAQYRMDL